MCYPICTIWMKLLASTNSYKRPTKNGYCATFIPGKETWHEQCSCRVDLKEAPKLCRSYCDTDIYCKGYSYVDHKIYGDIWLATQVNCYIATTTPCSMLSVKNKCQPKTNVGSVGEIFNSCKICHNSAEAKRWSGCYIKQRSKP